METKTGVHVALTILLTILSLAVLSVSIATLVKVYKNDDSKSESTRQSATSAAPSVITTSTTTPTPSLVSYKPQQIQSNDPKYQGFSDAVKRLKLLMDLQTDPCENFYQFTCGNYNGSVSFETRQNADYDIMLKILDDTTKQNYNTLEPVKQMLTYYERCKETDPEANRNNTAYVLEILNSFKKETGISFPAVDGTEWKFQKTAFSKAIGFLYGRMNIPTFLTPLVDTHWKRPDTGYKLFFDQPTLYYGRNYYLKAWDQVENKYRNSIAHILKVLRVNAEAAINDSAINNDINDMLNMEMEIAKNYSTAEEQKRLYERQFNEYNVTAATDKFQFIDWSNLLSQILFYADENIKTIAHSSNFIIQEPEVLQRLGEMISSSTGQFSSRTIANYFNVRIALSLNEFMQDKEAGYWNYVVSLPYVGRRKDVWRRPKPRRKIIDNKRYACAEATMYNLQYSNARVFLDAAYPKETDRVIDALILTTGTKKILPSIYLGKEVHLRKNIAQMTNSILVAFRGMLDQLQWMDESTRLNAYKKITYLVKNMAYPDFITNDIKLTEYYNKMEQFAATDDLLMMNKKIFGWSMWKVLSRLGRNVYEREHFDLPPGLVNAWYQPELNSLTLPLATLGQPFYDINWPSSLNYGSLGVIAGHELSHGFDDEGVQWDGKGFLSQWMSSNSYNSFREMAQCVINEYSNFKPPGMPNLSGEQTQGENIADNGGIRAAYRAYKNAANLYGEEPRLNDPVFSQFTHDQLFFIGFAQVWCESDATKYGTLEHDLTNPHSPSIFRVLGTLQNFPAFRNAFNCPLNKTYTPEKHCHVWVSEVSDDYGMPV